VPWVEKRLRGTRVWMKSDAAGNPVLGEDERVEIVYKLGGKPYRASSRNLDSVADAETVADDAVPKASSDPAPAESRGGAGASGAAKRPARAAASGLTPAEASLALHVYTDGACTGNPGPMGIGVVILDRTQTGESGRRELSRYLGKGTNNIAELTAIEAGLQAVDRDRPVVIYSDSSYAIGLLSQGWRAKANQELVLRLRALLREFPRVEFVKVAGHSGVPENERCDVLARSAIANRSAPRS
jgi:ribonuclease HI